MPDITTQGAPAGAAESGQTAQLEQTQAGVAHPQDDATHDAGDQQHEQAEGRDALTPEQREQRKAQRRIERLAAQRTEARTEVQMLRAQLADLQARQQPQDAGNDRQPPKTNTADDIEARATERAQEMRERERVAEKLSKVMEKGRKLEGFGAAVDALHEEVPITDRNGRPTAFFAAVLDSDDPAALAHYLGNNPDEAAEYRGLSPAQIGRRLAKLEDRLKRDAKQQTSKAPTPMRPVNSQASIQPDESKMTDAEWRAHRLKQRA